MANLVKLSGNFLIASVIEALGKAFALIGKAGIDRAQYLDILTNTLFGASVYKTYGKLIAEKHCELHLRPFPRAHSLARRRSGASCQARCRRRDAAASVRMSRDAMTVRA